MSIACKQKGIQVQRLVWLKRRYTFFALEISSFMHKIETKFVCGIWSVASPITYVYKVFLFT